MLTCKDCLHIEVCKYNDGVNMWSKGDCPHFKDKFKSVELPCKIGDTVYLVLKGTDDVLIGDVRKMSFNHKNELVICIGRQKGRYYTTGNHKISSFGKSVFLTKEEAEQALTERRW